MRIMQKTRQLLLASAIAAVTVGVLVVQYFVASQLAKADAINSTDFVMTIDTRKGTGNTFTVPTIGGGYNYTLVCGNGVVLTGQTGNATCSYATAGVYKVRIAGAFPRIYFDYRGDRFKVISIDQWGTNEWQNMEHAFDGAENLDVKATDKPRMGRVVSLAYMFRDAKSLKGEGADWQWDTKNVESLNSTFSGARQFNQNISSWNTSKVTDMDNTFTNAYEFNQPIQSWDVSKVNTMVAVLAYAKKFNQPIGEWNTTQLTDALLALAGAERFDQSLAHWDVRRLTDADRLLDGVKISTPNYDATLTSWQAQAVRGNVKLGGGNSNYCVAEAKRNDLIATKSWIITDAGKDCTAYTVTAVDYTGVTDVDENTTTGTVLGRLNSTDAVNSPQSDFTYTLDCAGAQNSLVAIDGNAIKLAQSPDYEQNTTLEICVRATNKAGRMFDKHLTISVNNLYSVSYNANGADAGAPPASTGETLHSGDSVSVEANINGLAKTGHSFTGWNTAPNGAGTPYAPGANFHLTGDITLYAQWQVNNYTLHFDSKGGSNVPDQTVAFGAKATTPTAPTKTGHTFAGWYKEAGLVNAWNFATDTMPASDTTLYAKWTVNQYKIHYDANTGTGGATPDTVSNYDTTVQIANNGFTKTGHSFTGWNTAPNGAGTPYAPGANFHLTGDITLYAQWQDTQPPVTPAAAPDMTATSDTGDSDSDNITNKNKPVFKLVCTEVGSTLTLYVDGAANGTVNCTNVGPVDMVPTAPLTEGNHSVTFKESDAAGNESPSSPALAVTIDTTAPAAPTVTMDPVTADNTINSVEAAAPQFIRGSVTGARLGDKARLTINGVIYEATIDATGRFSVTVPGAELVSDPDRTIDVVVTASDVAGNTTSINSSKTYNVDANVVVPPARATLKASSDTGSSDSDNITKNTRPVVTLQCISATDKLHLIVDGVEVQVVNCTSAGPIEVTLPNALSDGSHTVTYSRETSAGNVSAPSMPLTLTIDTTAPTGALTTQQATVASPALSGTVNDPTATVVVTINGVDYPAVVAGGIWTLPANAIAALGDGAYTVKMKFTDIAGNVSVAQGVLTISLPSSPLTPQPPQPGGVGVATPEQNKKKSHSSLAGTGDNLYLIIGVVCLTIAAGSIGLYRLRRRVR